mgnify:CR=1 FL=1
MATRDLISLRAEIEADIAKGLYSREVGQQILRNAGVVESTAGYNAMDEGIGLEGLTDIGYISPNVFSQANIARGYGDVGTSATTNEFLAALNRAQTGQPKSIPVGTQNLASSTGATNTFLADLAAMATPTPTVTPPVTPTPPTPLDPQAQAWETNFGAPGSDRAWNSFNNLDNAQLRALVANPDFLALYPRAKTMLDERPTVATPTTGQVPWDTMPANSLEQLLGKMNQGFYTTGSSGHYNSLTMLYRDAEAFLTSQNIELTDQKVYDAMGLIAQGAATQAGSTVANEYFWYDRNIGDWRNEGRPVRPGGPATGAILEAVTPSEETKKSQAELIDLFEENSDVAFADFDWEAAAAAGDAGVGGAGGAAATTDVPANLQEVFGTDATSSNNAANESYNDWIARGAPGREELETMTSDVGTGLPSLGAGAVLPGPTVTPFTTGVAGPEVGGPASMDIFGQMQTQENFPADVFRRFLAEQVSPSGEYQALSPFMMRGAQDLAPQLMSEYSASIYDPSNWTDAGNQSTFGDWLRAGQRPTRQGMFDTLQNIGSVVSAGQQGLTAPGLSLGESLRRQNIINQFGTETADSRQALQGLFSTAALKGVAPAFRYPVQSAAQNLFQTQRALQPEQSFLSFLGERL